MSNTTMSQAEREAFFAGLHVGVVAIPAAAVGAAPLSAPVWYDYEPGGNYWFLTGRKSRKGRLLLVGQKLTLVAQQEALPYAYVSVEGVVVGLRDCTQDDDTRPMARRYLGVEQGDAYTAATAAGDDSVRVEVRPERWLSVDYAKQ